MHKPSTQAALAVLAFALTAAPGAFAQAAVNSGHPDFTGTYTNASLTPLTRAKGIDSLVVDKATAAKIAASTPVAGVAPNKADDSRYVDPNKGAPEKGGADFGLKGYNSFWVTPGNSLALVRGEYRTSAIVDPPNGQLPYKNPAEIAKERRPGAIRYLTGVGGNAGPEDTNLAERCLIGFGGTGGPGMLGVLYNNNYEFVQSPHSLVILVEMDHDARIIPLFETASEARAHHKPDVITPWLGDSVGWWDGDTLVVETTNVRAEEGKSGSFPLSTDGVVTEHFTRDGPDNLFYQFTVNDPKIYTQPWKAELTFRGIKEHVYEYACHEGNYAMPHMLAGQRLEERQHAEAMKTKMPASKGKSR